MTFVWLGLAWAADGALWTACGAGESAACSAVAEQLAAGEPAPWRQARVRALRERACEGGDERACAALDQHQTSFEACLRGEGAACREIMAEAPLGTRLAVAERLCAQGETDACELPAQMGLEGPAVERWTLLPGGRAAVGPDGALIVRGTRPLTLEDADLGTLVLVDPRRGRSAEARVPVPLEQLQALPWSAPGRSYAEAMAGWRGMPHVDEQGRVGALIEAPAPKKTCWVWWLDDGSHDPLPSCDAFEPHPEPSASSQGRTLQREGGRWTVLQQGRPPFSFDAGYAWWATDGTLLAERTRQGPAEAWRDGRWVVLGQGVSDVWRDRLLVNHFDGDRLLKVVREGERVLLELDARDAELLPGGDLLADGVWIGLKGSEVLPAVVSAEGWRSRTIDQVRALLATLEPDPKRVTLSGRVLGPDGKPASGAAVEIRRTSPETSWARLPLDAQGAFSAPLPAASWQVRAVQEGHRGSSFRVKLDASTAPLELRLAPTALPIEVSVRMPDGQPVPGLAVQACGSVEPTGPDGVRRCVVAEPGDWELVEVEALDFSQRVSVLEPWRGDEKHPVAVAKVELAFEGPEGRVAHRLVDTCGRPVPGMLAGGSRTDERGVAYLPGPVEPDLYGFGIPTFHRVDGSALLPRVVQREGDAWVSVVAGAWLEVQGEPGQQGVLVGPEVRVPVEPGQRVMLTPGTWEIWTVGPSLAVRTLEIEPCRDTSVRLPRARPGGSGPLAVRVVDPDGWPIPEARVSISELPSGWRGVSSPFLKEVTDWEGRARFDAIVGGRRRVRVEVSGLGPEGNGQSLVLDGSTSEIVVVVPELVPLPPMVLWPHPLGALVRSAEAGVDLSRGDRIVAVGGRSVQGWSVAEIVVWMQRSPGELTVSSADGVVRTVPWAGSR